MNTLADAPQTIKTRRERFQIPENLFRCVIPHDLSSDRISSTGRGSVIITGLILRLIGAQLAFAVRFESDRFEGGTFEVTPGYCQDDEKSSGRSNVR